jgi:selenide,water dikinase
LSSRDDAAVLKIDDEKALVFTADFFAPVLDDPYAYGSVAAANALSDIYAMGGVPQMALNLVAWPDDMDPEIITKVLRGAFDKVAEAGAYLAGGHTVRDTEPKFGLAVTGVVHPDRIFRSDGAKIGDVIVLTKPLGSGVITTALKETKVEKKHLETCVSVMAKLNKGAMLAARSVHPYLHAATDVTGYGLIGHAHEMATGAGCSIEIELESLPWIVGSQTYAKAGMFSGGATANKEYYSKHVTYADKNKGVEWQTNMLFDPQTSGGLLLSVHRDHASDLLAALAKYGSEDCCVVGRVVAGEAGRIVVD